jgi:hypothetical protein
MSRETFQEYLEEKLKEMKQEPFQPNAWFNEDGDLLEAYWDESRAYGVQTKNGRMTIMRSVETEEIVGVKVYGIRKLMGMEK